MKPNHAKFIWSGEAANKGRNLYSFFRRKFEVAAKPRTAIISLFADTSYQLFVNGELVGFGPLRFDPRYPRYDSHDLMRFLKLGENVIEVKVNYFGCKTYKSVSAQAGMVAWGAVCLENNSKISLHTDKCSWLAISPKGYSNYAPKLSFALNAAEILVLQKEETNWQNAIEIQEQDAWGDLSARNIPYLMLDEVEIDNIKHLLPISIEEDIYSFQVPVPHFYEDNKDEFSNFIAFSTWIFSPIEQSVEASTFWGEYWLNGVELCDFGESKQKNMCIEYNLELKEGWNYFLGTVMAFQDVFQFYFGLPQGKGLRVSAEKDSESPFVFRHSQIQTQQEYETKIKKKKVPFAHEDEIREIGGWRQTLNSEKAQGPCRETGWDMFAQAQETLEVENLTGHVFSKKLYPEGFSLLLDLGQTKLVLPKLSFVGVSGTTFDVTYGEHLDESQTHIMHLHHYSLGDRLICLEDSIDWMPINARGGRYVLITARNTTGDITLKQVKFRSITYPVTEVGEFSCSDEKLNEIWEMGRRTLKVCMDDVYSVDPCRERGLYARDTLILFYMNLAAFGDYALMNRSMELFGQSTLPNGHFRAVYPNTGNYFISDFSLDLIEAYKAYYDHTGDKDRIKTDWQAILGSLKWFERLADTRADMLLDSEWNNKTGEAMHYGGFHGDLQIAEGYLDNSGISCVFSCTYLLALRYAVALAEAIGEDLNDTDLKWRIEKLSDSISEKFWDLDAKCFADNLDFTTHSLHANLYAIRAEVVSAERIPSVKKHIKSDLKSVFVNGNDPEDGVLISPSYSFFILDGLYKANLIETAENLMRDGWGWMIDQGFKTLPEYYKIGLESSLCHAWSGAPTYYLSKYLLGIEYPDAPNLDCVNIQVKSHGITWAEGAFPHPRGEIKVKWHMDGRKRVFDHVIVPEGVTIKFLH
ncbi:MAG: alpha-L-rhamnosidase C-terminal domain-containing protein [Bacillota bacterium]